MAEKVETVKIKLLRTVAKVVGVEGQELVVNADVAEKLIKDKAAVKL